MALAPISQKQAKIVISAIPGIFWTSNKGGKLSREEVKYNNGQTGLEQTYVGFSMVEPLTLSKPYDPVADKAIAAFVTTQRSNGTPFSITVTPVQADVAGSPLAGAVGVTYPNCVLTGYKPADFDRNGQGLAMIEVTVAVNGIPTY
jgi:hypothetical protein